MRSDDAATEGQENGVAVGSGGDELFGERFDLGHALEPLPWRKEEGDWLRVGGERCEKALVPKGPDLRGGDDEGLEWLRRG